MHRRLLCHEQNRELADADADADAEDDDDDDDRFSFLSKPRDKEALLGLEKKFLSAARFCCWLKNIKKSLDLTYFIDREEIMEQLRDLVN